MSNNAKAQSHKLRSRGDVVFDVINYTLLIVLCLLIFYPLYYVIIASVTDPKIVNTGKLLFYPEQIYLEGYSKAFEYPSLIFGYKNTIKYTLVSVIVSLATTIPAAYALSRKDLPGRRAIMFLFSFTMFFSGGLIPLFLTIKKLGIYNSTWALVLPAAVSVYNLIVCRSFFESTIPVELLEAAKIDGCSDLNFFFKMAIPLSSTIIAVMALFYATAMWNTFFNALMFLQDDNKMPLQVVLRNLVLSNQLSAGSSGAEMAERRKVIDQLKYVIITVAALPLIAIYPFVQKFFVAGVTIGAVKG
ncbi:MAG: carbohydrate ABC transporter permease [Christensenellales bacterium]|jgi:putative aldouronate transport system permease protein